MNLTESYNELYNAAKAYNETIFEEEQEQKRFSDLESFLKQNSSEIKKFELEPVILQMFQAKNYSVEKIMELIQAKQQEEADRERLRREEEQRRIEEERIKQKKKEEQRKKIIKWVLITIAIIVIALVIIKIVIPWIIANIWWIIIGIAIIVFVVVKFSKN